MRSCSTRKRCRSPAARRGRAAAPRAVLGPVERHASISLWFISGRAPASAKSWRSPPRRSSSDRRCAVADRHRSRQDGRRRQRQALGLVVGGGALGNELARQGLQRLERLLHLVGGATSTRTRPERAPGRTGSREPSGHEPRRKRHARASGAAPAGERAAGGDGDDGDLARDRTSNADSPPRYREYARDHHCVRTARAGSP